MDSIDLRVIESSIREIEATLKHCIISNNICRVDDSISWSNYQKGIIKNTYYPIEYQSIIDRRQYSLLFSDLSAIQFYYNFALYTTNFTEPLSYQDSAFLKLPKFP